MEIQQLKGFHAVAKYRNFTIAAQKTQRTQPTISLQIKALEDELGIKLFERLGPRKVTLTREGEILLELTAPLLQEFSSVIMRFNEARGIYSTSSVRIVTHSSVMIYLLPKAVKRFKEQFPDCQLSILNRSRKEIISMLDNGEADLGVTSLDVIPPNIEYRVFSRYNRILIATKGHPLSQKQSIGLEEIAQYPLVLPTQESNTRRIIEKLFEEKKLPFVLAMEVVGRAAIKTYVGMNLGISIINEYYVTEEDKTTLFVRNMSRHFGKAETGIVTRKSRDLPYPAQEFIKLIQSSVPT